MISISSLMGGSSSSSSIGNMNSITGLASGLDTEAMIEGMVQSYQQKIISLRQDSTKLSWQQDAYRSISDKLVSFATKYTSYTSNTNIFSATFFTSSVTINPLGEFADKIAATGKSDSNIVINSVNQLATAAQYKVKKSDDQDNENLLNSVSTIGGEVDLSENVTVYDTSGALKFTYDGVDYTVNFDENEDIFQDEGSNVVQGGQQGDARLINLNKLATLINDKLKGSDAEGNVTAKVENGELKLIDKNGDEVALSEESDAGFLAKTGDTVKIPANMGGSVKTGAEHLKDASFTVTFNGQTKTIKLDNIQGSDVAKALNEKLADAFGKDKITTKYEDGAFSFSTAEGNTFKIAADDANMGEVLFGDKGTSVENYLDMNKTLEDLGILSGDATKELFINGKKIGSYTADTSVQKILDDINSNTEVGVSVGYSKLTNSFTFTSEEMGEAGNIDISDSFATQLFGKSEGKVTTGQDAEIIATVNGETMKITRNSNSIDLDGMTITLKGKFNESLKVEDVDTEEERADGVSFSSTIETDKIIDGIKSMINDFNTMIKEIKDAYTTAPLKQTNGSKYEPLTEDEEAELSDTEIEKYNEKAKTGLLYMDSTLSSLYNDLRSAVIPGGSDGAFLRSIGIETKYEDGLTTLTLDEDKLKEALETNLDGVKDAFIKSKDKGATTDGFMASLQEVTDKYAKTIGADKGLLIEKAGSQFSASSELNNEMRKELEEIDEEIQKWQDKLSNKVDFYTRQFTQLELLINQMNSQSSTLAGLTGGY